MLSPFANLPAVKFGLKKDFSEKQKRFVFHLDMEKYLAKSVSSFTIETLMPYLYVSLTFQLKLVTFWKYDSIKKLEAQVDIETPFEGFEKTIAGGLVNIAEDKSIIMAQVILNALEVAANVTLKKNVLNATASIDVQNKKYLI